MVPFGANNGMGAGYGQNMGMNMGMNMNPQDFGGYGANNMNNQYGGMGTFGQPNYR